MTQVTTRLDERAAVRHMAVDAVSYPGATMGGPSIATFGGIGMANVGAYFDAILFGRLLLTALVVVDPRTQPGQAPARLADLVRSRTGVTLDPQEVEAIIDGEGRCDVSAFRAIVETLEPPGGAHWFDPAFKPRDVRDFWAICRSRETSDA